MEGHSSRGCNPDRKQRLHSGGRSYAELKRTGRVVLYRDIKFGWVCLSSLFIFTCSRILSETNLKIKQASTLTSSLTNPSAVLTLNGSLRSEHPNNSLYTYEGTLDLRMSSGVPKQVPLGPDQILLRGAQLRNTPWVYGLTVFTGHETKLMRNAT